MGKLIVIEGPDCSGKDSLIESLNLSGDFIISREPGGTEIGEKIRNIILDKNHTEIDDVTTFLLFSAARRQHIISKVSPTLKEGKNVVLNRYYYSSAIYQGMLSNNGKGLSVPFVSETIKESIRIGDDMMIPDLSIILYSSDFSILEKRLRFKEDKDRLELNDIEYFERINREYKYMYYNTYINSVEMGSKPKYAFIDIANYVDNPNLMARVVHSEISSILNR